MTERFANEPTTTLTAGINAAVTSLVVSSATGFPAANFRIRVDNEIMLVTAVAGTTWTVTRAAEAVNGVQVAATHAILAAVAHVLTAGGLAQALLESGPVSAYFAIFDGTNQSIANTTVTDLTFASETEDLLAMHSTVSNTNRVVIPTSYSGLWIFSVTLGWSAGGTGFRICNIAVNGTVVCGNTWPPFSAVVRDSLTTPPIRVVQADIITAHVYQDSGGSLGVDGTSLPILFKGAKVG